jgi:alkaline phosphatase D
MKKILMLLMAVVMLASCSQKSAVKTTHYTLVVSLDGFRWDYPQLYDTPFLDSMASVGVKAVSLQPSYPSKTFPNHYTLATGLYPDHHGLVNNAFYDPEQDRYYQVSNREAVMDGTFYGGEPIWVTAEKQGLKAASYFWVGSEADIQGIRPSIWKKYHHQKPYGQRIDSIISWFQRPLSERPRFAMLYFDQPDGVGHHYGPESPETGKVIHRLDSLMNVLHQKLKSLPLYDSLNVIITSDHGMAMIYEDSTIILSDIVNMEWIQEIQGGNPAYSIMAREGYVDSIMNALTKVSHLKAWKTGQEPAHLHYGTHPRTLDITVTTDPHWSVYAEKPDRFMQGTHGYDPAFRDMHTIFYAMGPAFARNKEVRTFYNVDVYNVMCKTLNLKPAPNDGKPERIMSLFR